jgi:hypothetical protein
LQLRSSPSSRQHICPFGSGLLLRLLAIIQQLASLAGKMKYPNRTFPNLARRRQSDTVDPVALRREALTTRIWRIRVISPRESRDTLPLWR